MKKKIIPYVIILSVLAFILGVLISCDEKGEVRHVDDLVIIIHGKQYELSQLFPCDNCTPIWIFYPTDSTTKQPLVVNYPEQQGKSRVNKTVVIIK